MADVDPAAFIAGTVTFRVALPPNLRSAWLRTCTRTVFPAGLPTAVALRHRQRHMSPSEYLVHPQAHTTHTRITQDPRDPGRLRLYAVLTSDRGRPRQGGR